MAKLQICVQCYRYQRRLWWMLSSLFDQQAFAGTPVPEIVVRINTHKDDQFKDWNERLKSVFCGRSGPIQFDFVEWDTHDYGRRGATRNRDVAECEAEWILFADGDQVFHPHFFAHAMPIVEQIDNRGNIIATYRYTMSEEQGDGLVGAETYLDAPIKDTHVKCQQCNTWIIGKSQRIRECATGNFQLVKIDTFRRNKRRYAEDVKYDINVLDVGRVPYATNCDWKFRHASTGVTRGLGFLPIWHLNHQRTIPGMEMPQ